MIAVSNDVCPSEMGYRNLKKRHIIVTGASGFVGKWLCKGLVELGYEVTGLSQREGDVTQKDFFEKYIDFEISHLFHLAAQTFVPDSWEDPRAFYNTNVNGTLNALEFCRTKNIPITYVSAYIYGAQESQPICENARIHPSNPYAHSKCLAEQLCEYYAGTFSTKCTVIRPFNVYGQGQSHKFLIPTIINQVLNSPKIHIKDIRPKRDYLYIKDFIDILILTMKGRNQFSVYNAGSGYSLSVSDVIRIIQKVCHKNKTIESEKLTRRSEIEETIADIGKLKVDYEWEPKFTFEAGIKDFVVEQGESR